MKDRVAGSLALGAALALCSCGAGSALVAAATGGDGGSNGAATITLFQVAQPKVAPATLRLEVSDPEGNPVAAEFFFKRAGQPEAPMSALAGPGVAGSEVMLSSSRDGVATELTWDFVVGLGGTGFVPAVDLIVRRSDGTALNGGTLQIGMGNDPPVITSIAVEVDPLEQQVVGVGGTHLIVADTSDDLVSIRVEYDIAGDDPDLGFQLARPDLTPTTPTFGIANVQASSAGTELQFHWDTDVDLHDLERDVVLRFTPRDEIAEGLPVLSPPFRVDNNAEPVLQLRNDLVISNADQRRGIPVPFRLIDEESDEVEVIFQWRRSDEVFPPLAEGEIDSVLADPVLRRERHICSEYPHFAQGFVERPDATSVRLPELAAGESWIVAHGIEGRTLECLRPAALVEPITVTWSANPLAGPVAALPLGDGLAALVLDAPGGTSWRLRAIELAAGHVLSDAILAAGAGEPSAMTCEIVPGGKPSESAAVLISSAVGGTWAIERVELASGLITELAVSGGSANGLVRGLASLGRDSAVFTAGSELFFLDYQNVAAPRIVSLVSGLASPWGVVVDPLKSSRLYVAEREANRIIELELDTRARVPLVVRTADMVPGDLDRPEALAFDSSGARMLVVTSTPGGAARIVIGLPLGARGDNVPFAIGPPIAGAVGSVASGPDGLALIALPGTNELLVGGGLEQRRTIANYGHGSQRVGVEMPFVPPLRQGRRWRISAGLEELRGSPAGVAHSFLWDSADAGGGPIFLRGAPRDEELGIADDGAAAKAVRSPLDVEPVVLPVSAFGLRSVAVADLDQDGDQDVVSATMFDDQLAIFFQQSDSSFGSAPLVLGGTGIISGPRSVTSADFDQDGDQDVVSANSEGDDLTVFFQSGPGTFDPTPLVLTLPRFSRPACVVAADLDQDDDQDIIAANAGDSGFDSLAIFFQHSPGVFTQLPLLLGGMQRPASVAAADLDQDGDLDLVSSNIGSQDLTVFFQVSPGSFAAPLVLGQSPTFRSASVVAADLDQDGDQDLACANYAGHDLRIFFQNPGGIFASPLVLGGSATLFEPTTIVAADVDGDGDQDVVTNTANDLGVFLQEEPGRFTLVPQVLPGIQSSTRTFQAFVAADLDQDGHMDVVSASDSDIMLRIQSSPGIFASSPLVLGGGLNPFLFAASAADLDQDGDQDLAAVEVSGHKVTLYLQDFAGIFAPLPLVLGGSASMRSPLALATADLDQDGDVDVVTVNAESHDLTVFFQDAPGEFAAAPLVLGGPAVTGMPFSVAVADLDQDNDMDIVSANHDSENLTVFFQESPGIFAAVPLVLGGPDVTNGPFSVAVADLDEDGDTDIVSANNDGEDLTVFFQGSPGSFVPIPLTLPLGGLGPISVVSADLDQDGDQDLVSANLVGSLTIFFQLTAGSFARTPLVLAGGVEFHSVTAGDCDRDGDQDLVAADPTNNHLALYFQECPGRFAPPLLLGDVSLDFLPNATVATDVDHDGELDLVSANGRNLMVLWGGR